MNGAAPQLGDGVYVGPGAVLYGGIKLGSGAVVGANSVVHKDVQARGSWLSTSTGHLPIRLDRRDAGWYC
ncbi:hypothetical protein GS498_19680 [Rhodococcus hoagii]|nr:hypothetical protein [Prescottella equi]